MRAIVQTGYGAPDVLTLRELPRPTPARGEVLIEVRAASVTSADSRLRAMRLPSGFGLIGRLIFGVFGPRRAIPGVELAGVVVAVGPDVRRFSMGDSVFGLSSARMGAHAEYVALPERSPLASMPPGLTFEDAAALAFGGLTMRSFYRRASLTAGERVLVNGASGAVGVAAVQLARLAGAHVTAVCSARNAELARSLGAERVIDYALEDFAEAEAAWDVVVDTVGNAPYPRVRRALRPGGRLLAVVATLGQILRSPFVDRRARHRVVAGPGEERVEDLEALAALVERGEYRAVIDRTYPLEEIAAAHALVDGGHKRGSVVLLVQPRGESTRPGQAQVAGIADARACG